MLTPPEEVLATILAVCDPLPPVDLPLQEALGCVAAAPVVAAADVPPFANSAMDGYAVRAADTAAAPVELQVIGLLPAGAAPDREVGAGQAIRIMTGAPMPPGADAVVMVERTSPLDGGAAVRVETAVDVDQNVRFAGSDLRAGQQVVEPGTVLTPALLGVAASAGAALVRVHPRPVAGVLSTGDELVEPPGELLPGRIYDSNRPLLIGLLAEAGCRTIDLGRAPDDPDAIRATLAGALADAGCDAILLTGGVSVGDFDFAHAVFGRLGTAHACQIAIKPAKPLAWGLSGPPAWPERRGCLLFGLPGNPVSAAVSFELFARPALRRLAGHREPRRPLVPAVAGEPLHRRADGKLHLVRVVADFGEDGRLHVRSAGGQGSHMLRALAAGNALALLPDGVGVAEGDPVQVMLLGPG